MFVERKSWGLGQLACVILLASIIGLVFLYYNIIPGDFSNKIGLVLILAVITEAIIFGGLFYYIISRKKRKAIEKGITPPKNECWIATAVYGDPFQSEIEILRDFRDTIMDATKFGHELTKFYYKTSPPIAKVISNSINLRKLFKFTLIEPFVRISESILKLKHKNYAQDLKIIRKYLRNKYFNRYSNHS